MGHRLLLGLRFKRVVLVKRPAFVVRPDGLVLALLYIDRVTCYLLSLRARRPPLSVCRLLVADRSCQRALDLRQIGKSLLIIRAIVAICDFVNDLLRKRIVLLSLEDQGV